MALSFVVSHHAESHIGNKASETAKRTAKSQYLLIDC